MTKVKQPKNRPIRLENGKEGYELTEAYTYFWNHDNEKYRIIIPKGFQSDGCSTPRIVWTLIGLTPDGLVRGAAAVHDFLCRYEGNLPAGSYQKLHNGVWWDLKDRWSWKDAARMFARVMKECGVSKFKRRMAYRGVIIYGWFTAWKL